MKVSGSGPVGVPAEPTAESPPGLWPAAVRLLFLALVVAKAAAYWIGSAILRPHDLLSTIVMYRGKDIQSFPIVHNLASLGFGEPSLYEGHNLGVLSERVAPWVIHAFLFRLAGPAGFIVADLLLTPLRYFLLARLLRLCGINRMVALAVSAVLTCAAIDDFGEFLPQSLGIPLRFWGLRLPRPYVSELFLLLALIGALAALEGIREGKRSILRHFALAGAGLAVLSQCDFHTACGLGLAFAGMAAWILVKEHDVDRALLVRGTMVAVGTAGVFALPAMAQLVAADPESMVRLGFYAVSRWHPPFIHARGWYAAAAALAAVAWQLNRLARANLEPERHRQVLGRAMMIALSVGALVAMPVSSAILGRTAQLYHFRDSFVRCFSLALLVMGLHLAERIWKWAAAGRPARQARSGSARRSPARFEWALVLPAAVACAMFVWRFGAVAPTHSDHLRSDFEEWAALTDYRRSFAELTSELTKHEYDGRKVMGTFDHQVWSWWVTFRGGYSFLADACITDIPDREIERRTAALARIIGMTPDDFGAFVRRRYVDVFWIGCDKYQATSGFSFASTAEYSTDERRRIAASPDYLNFSLILPESDKARLGSLFASLDLSHPDRLDMIVLTKDRSVAQFAPPRSEFDLAYENAMFRVWTRRPPPQNDRAGLP